MVSRTLSKGLLLDLEVLLHDTGASSPIPLYTVSTLPLGGLTLHHGETAHQNLSKSPF